jgi:hypothetical protein
MRRSASLTTSFVARVFLFLFLFEAFLFLLSLACSLFLSPEPLEEVRSSEEDEESVLLLVLLLLFLGVVSVSDDPVLLAVEESPVLALCSVAVEALFESAPLALLCFFLAQPDSITTMIVRTVIMLSLIFILIILLKVVFRSQRLFQCWRVRLRVIETRGFFCATPEMLLSIKPYLR